MATATTAQRRDVKEYTFIWEGIDRNNRQVRGESKAASETVVTTNLRRQGIRIVKIRRQTFRGGRKVNEKDITFFTRQLATMLKAGVPLLQSFEIVARGHSNARVCGASSTVARRFPAPTVRPSLSRQRKVLYWRGRPAGLAAGAPPARPRRPLSVVLPPLRSGK